MFSKNQLLNKVNRLKLHIQEDSLGEFLLRTIKIMRIQFLQNPTKYFIHVFRNKLTLSSEDLKKESNEYQELDDDFTKTKKILAKEEINSKEIEVLSREIKYDEIEEPFISELEDCVIIGEYSLAFKQGKAIDDVVNHSGGKNKRFSSQLGNQIISSPKNTVKSVLGRPETSKKVDTALVMNNSNAKYYFHWIIEHLTKLRGIEGNNQFSNYKEISLIIPNNPPKFIKSSLDHFFPNADIVEAHKSETIKAKNLIVPSFPQITPKNVEWLYQKSEDVSSDQKADYPTRIFISRQNAKRRKVENFCEVKELLEKYSIEPIEMENYTFKEQISLINNADLIVGPHGGGLTNIVWGQNLHVIELFNQHINDLYYILANISGHEYQYTLNKGIGAARSEKHKNLEVDTEKLENKLKNAGI